MEQELVKSKGMRLKLKRVVVVSLIVFLVVCLIILVAIPIIMMNQVVNRRMMRDVYDPSHFGIEAKNITLQTEDGLNLASWLVETDSPKATVIILSGIENPSVTAFFSYAKMLKGNGYNSLLIEMRAHNDSEGDEVALGMLEWKDVKAGVDYLKNHAQLKNVPIVAMGTSMGGATANVAAGEIPEIDAVISISSFSSWPDVFGDMMTGMGMPSMFALLEKPFVNLYNGFHYGFKNLNFTPLNGIEKLGERPILLMHSLDDTQVPYASYERLLARANSAGVDVTTFVREGDEHFILYPEFFETPEKDVAFSNAIINFLDFYFG